jgi:hypothetical protein
MRVPSVLITIARSEWCRLERGMRADWDLATTAEDGEDCALGRIAAWVARWSSCGSLAWRVHRRRVSELRGSLGLRRGT